MNASNNPRPPNITSNPRNRLETLASFGFESEQLLWKCQAGSSESIIIKSQADDVRHDTEEWVVVQIESVCFPVHYVRAYRTSHGYFGEMAIDLTATYSFDQTSSWSTAHPT